MLNRRTILQGGLSAAALGALARRGWPRPLSRQGLTSGFLPADPSAPIRRIANAPESIVIDGMPFAKWLTGDDFQNHQIPFHEAPGCPTPPPATEEVDVAIVGGGLSGLASAYLLRDHDPVVFELRERFGGVAQGEHWDGTTYSLGNAYVITPDDGTFLDRFYTDVGLRDVVRVDEGDFYVEVGGQILKNYLDGIGQPPEVARAFARYREVVLDMAENNYPDIPFPERDQRWIAELDQKTFRDDILEQMGVPVPDELAAVIQAYCYSSFAAGWEEISAASGWNFLAAEEYGRWVSPGGNSFMVQSLWHQLRRAGRRQGTPSNLRNGCQVVDVRLVRGGKVQVSYLDSEGVCRSLLARQVVMSSPKFLCKQLIDNLYAIDQPKVDAMERLEYRAYVVANVLVDAPIPEEFYDVFLLGDDHFPMNETEVEADSRVIDLLNGHFARTTDPGRSVLTLYWPLSFDNGRWTLLIEQGFTDYAHSLVPQLDAMLSYLGLERDQVRQIRLTRWGHAVPIARPGLIADGTTDDLRRSVDDRIWFVHQDNWALPAVENCLLDAEIFTAEVAARL